MLMSMQRIEYKGNIKPASGTGSLHGSTQGPVQEDKQKSISKVLGAKGSLIEPKGPVC